MSNCKEYEFNKPEVCKECENGYILVNGVASYCYRLDDRLRCNKVDSSKFANGVVFCEECWEG